MGKESICKQQKHCWHDPACKSAERSESELMRLVMPLQPIKDYRFVPNRIVEFLLDNGGYDMNDLAMMSFTEQERTQFASLIGYSVSGFGDLSYVDDETYESACRIADIGESEDKARNTVLRNQLNDVRQYVKNAVTTLFKIHPDDLET